ncbi:MAG: hypothetical protein ACXVCM_11895, partial [Ktedonobacteraceae bacterium]
TCTKEQGLGQSHRDGFVYQHPWRKQRLRLGSAERRSMPEQTGMERTALPRCVQVLPRQAQAAQAVGRTLIEQLDAGS